MAELCDYGSFCELWNSVWPNVAKDVDELRRDDAFPVHLRTTRWLASLDGADVGFAEAYRPAGSYHEANWLIEVGVKRDLRGKGTGTQLFRQALNFVELAGMEIADTRVSGEDEHSLLFAGRRGFSEVSRDFESVLDLCTCDREFLQNLAAAAQELEIKPIVVCDSPEFRRLLHEAFEEVRKDVPRMDPPVPLTLEFFLQATLEDPAFLMEGSHVLMDGEHIAGFAGLFQGATEGRIDTWLTSLRRPYRGRGLAQAMKAKTILWAIENGYASIRTDNNSANTSMLAINDKFGFQRCAAILTMRREA